MPENVTKDEVLFFLQYFKYVLFSGNRGNPVYELKSTFCGALGLPFTDTYEKRQNKMS